MASIKPICTCCGNARSLDGYYASPSPFHKYTKKLHVCKKCIWDSVKGITKDDIGRVKDTLRMIDRPFIESLWQSSVEESENVSKELFGIYMKNSGMFQYRDLTWADSEFTSSREHVSISSDSEQEENDIDEEVIKYWGRGYLDWEYAFLEEERFNLMSSFECPDYGMEMIMKDICFINLDIEKVRQERKDNGAKVITNLIETRSKLMNDANMKPIQSTGAEGNDQVTFGTLIKKWENERPIPKPIDDEMKTYIDTYMVGHLAKMEGLTNDMTRKYDKALEEHTIDFTDIHKDDEEFDE